MVQGEKSTDGTPDRRTWELELLISGAILFALLQLPSKLAAAFLRLEVNLEKDPAVILSIVHIYLQFTVYVLIGTLVVHLAARAYWVGLIGLRTVFPRGVRWRQLTIYGPRTEAFYRAGQPSLGTAIQATNAFCSSLFSIAFALSSIFILSILIVSPLASFLFYIDRIFFGGERLFVLLYGALMPIFLLPAALTLIDKKIGPKRKNDRLTTVVRVVLRPYYWLFLIPLINPIMMTFRSHSRRAVFYAVYALVFVALLTMVGGMLAASDSLSYNSLIYFPTQPGERTLAPVFYEDQRKPGTIHTLPSIPSDIVEGPYVRLFLPYLPRRFNDQMAIRCPDLEPRRANGFRFSRKSAYLPSSDEALEATAATAECFASLHEITLDGRRLEASDSSFYRQPVSGVRGLLIYLPTADLVPGKHILRIRTQTELSEPTSEQSGTDAGSEAEENEAEDETLREYVIPFWH